MLVEGKIKGGKVKTQKRGKVIEEREERKGKTGKERSQKKNIYNVSIYAGYFYYEAAVCDRLTDSVR